ncbi:hypothetical protein JCM8547_003701, partial [Rhodosporidiobolus lusitaniae]
MEPQNAEYPITLLTSSMSLSVSSLPRLPSSAAAPPPHSAPQGSLASSRPKRRLSNATQLSLDEDDEAGYSDDEHLPKQRTKRRVGGGGGAGTSVDHSPKQHTQPGKALSEKEKESRRIARMIRNRNAA